MIQAVHYIGEPATLPIIAIKTEAQIRTRNGFDEESLTELANSIREVGILEPLIVRRDPTDDAQHIVIAGERRLLAASMAGLAEVPVLIRAADEAQAATLQAIENLQRENLGLADTADGVAALLTHYKTPKAVAKALGKSPAWVSKHLAITKLSDWTRNLLANGCNDAEILLGIDQIARISVQRGHPKKEEAGVASTILAKGLEEGTTTRQKVRETLQDLKAPKAQPRATDDDEGEDDGESGDGDSSEGTSKGTNREIFGKLELAQEVAAEILSALEYAQAHKPSSRPKDATIEHVREFIAKTWA